ncbi:Tetratricopeptide-like helical [Penicillium cf. griseofulvum]|uniref:Tetratricopeptide-like helical n=1 Tax=Penicillium cf. griseofulvum TaxID=2972120 RepID=A0A9W9T2C4_9EURO|nr:Tetratricopeptide-like helical [Penicillium cf. griseofulvum]KAJ5448189.1 Tetratricopeptide-like helical [Penicillium cf. griseofulvum]
MLERTTGSLENAGRRFLRDSNGVIQNRRCLSDHFWKHSDTRADAPQWFIALLQASGQRPSPVLSTQHESRESSDEIGPLFEFLYPRQAQLGASRLSRSQNRTGLQRRSHLGFSRSYVSISSLRQATAAASLSREDASKPALDPQHLKSLHNDGKADASLQAFLRKNGSEFDKAWVLYVAAGYPPKLKPALCAYMSKSSKEKERKRAWALFNEIAPEDRTEIDFKNIIRSQLLSLPAQKPFHLDSICQQAISTPFAQDIISLGLVHMVENRQWAKIALLWRSLLETPEKERPTLGSLLDRFDRFHFPEHSLSRHLLALKAHLPTATNNITAANKLAIIDFTRRLVGRFFKSHDIVKLTPIPTVLSLLRTYHSLGFLENKHYSAVVRTFLSSKQRSEFVKCILVYRQLRLDLPDARVEASMIRAIIQRLLEFGMTDSIPYFLDEEAHFDEDKKPSIRSYDDAMGAFSKIGDVQTVQRLFDRFLADHGRPKTSRSVTPLLAVHARLGDVCETRRQFGRIPTEFGIPLNTICWNILLLAYTTAGDLSGAMSTFSEMREHRVPPDSYTFGTLMGIFAQRGDVEAIRQLLKEAQASGVQITRPMLDTAVQAYCKNGQLGYAEELVESSWDLAVGGSPLRMWNFLLMRYAFRVSKFSFRRILDRMGQLGLKPDDMTYAAIMLAYVYAMQVDRARATLRKMHDAGFEPTQYHYSILLLGYVKQRNRDMVHVISREMQARFGQVGMEGSLLNLRMQIARDAETAGDLQTPVEDIVLENAEKTLSESIANFNANPSPVKTRLSNTRLSSPLEGFAVESFTATHYQRLVEAYGIQGAAEKALQTFSHYLQVRRTAGSPVGDDLKSLPVDFIKAIMNAYLKTHKYEKVEECWNSIMASVSKKAGTSDLEKFFSERSPMSTMPAPAESPLPSVLSLSTTQAEKPKILHAQRFILDFPLSLYIQSLARRGMFERIHQVVAEVQATGFALTGFNWSTYVRMLATSDNYPDNMEAFRLFEEKFIAHFPGWSWFLKGYGVRPLNAPVTILHLEGRSGITKPRRMMGKLARKHWRKIEPDYMHPHYPTMVQLASTLQRLRQTSITEGNEHLANLYEIAPRTVDALAAMPYVRDKHQGTILRGKEAKSDILPRPTHLFSTHSGALGPVLGPHRAQERTFDDASQEPFELKKDQYSEPSGNESSLTGLLSTEQLGEFGSLSEILPREDRIDLETSFHDHYNVTRQWKEKAEHYKELVAKALKDEDIPRADAYKRRLRKLQDTNIKRQTPERQLFDKDSRKYKLDTPIHSLFKPVAGLHVKPGRTVQERKSERKRYKGPWTPREEQSNDS